MAWSIPTLFEICVGLEINGRPSFDLTHSAESGAHCGGAVGG